MRRLSTALVLGCLALLLTVLPAGAWGVSWCRSDPIVRLNGSEVQIWVAIPDDYEKHVTGPIDVRIATPRKVTREIVLIDPGFNGHGETVEFLNRGGRVRQDGSFRVDISVRVPVDPTVLRADQAVPVKVEVIFNGKTRHYNGFHNGTSLSIMVMGAAQ